MEPIFARNSALNLISETKLKLCLARFSFLLNIGGLWQGMIKGKMDEKRGLN